MELGRFPAELLQVISLNLSLFDFKELARSNKHIRSVLGRYSYRYLISIQDELTFNVELLVTIEQTDSFVFALDCMDRVVILHQQADGSTVYLLDFHPSGRLEARELESRESCLMDEQKCLGGKCSFCTNFHVRKFIYTIDKRYLVFFASWSDNVSFGTGRGIFVNLVVRHVPSIYYRHGIRLSEVLRYGLLLTESDVEWGESVVQKFASG